MPGQGLAESHTARGYMCPTPGCGHPVARRSEGLVAVDRRLRVGSTQWLRVWALETDPLGLNYSRVTQALCDQ